MPHFIGCQQFVFSNMQKKQQRRYLGEVTLSHHVMIPVLWYVERFMKTNFQDIAL
jgi:hypothetical protein